MTPWVVKLLGFLAGLLVLYAGECLVWPHVRCPRCGGRGEHQEWWGVRAWRDCRRCGGSGQRERLGVRLWRWSRRGDR